MSDLQLLLAVAPLDDHFRLVYIALLHSLLSLEPKSARPPYELHVLLVPIKYVDGGAGGGGGGYGGDGGGFGGEGGGDGGGNRLPLQMQA